MSLEEAILDRLRRLPSAKQEEALRFAGRLQRESSVRRVACRGRSNEMKWIDSNRAHYADQWVAVEHVFAEAKAQGIEVPFLVHILAEEGQAEACPTL